MTKLEQYVEITRLSKLADQVLLETKLAMAEFQLDKTDAKFRECELKISELSLVTTELKHKLEAFQAKYGGKNA